MGFLNFIKKVPVIGQVVSAGEAIGNITVQGVKILTGIIKTFDKFPVNIICGILVLLLTIIHEIVKVEMFGYIAVFFVNVIPFLLRMLYIFLRYTTLVILTMMLQYFDTESDVEDGKDRTRSNIRKFIIFLQTCHPDPRQWYSYPQNHMGNSHNIRLGMACMKPCRSNYVPAWGGLICKKTDRRIPRYCPRAMIMRAFEGMEVDGSKNFAFSTEYAEACKAQTVPMTSFENKYGALESASETLMRGVCQQSRFMVDKPGEVAHACHDTYCKRGDRHPFCSRIDPEYEDLAGNSPAELMKIPALVVLAALLLQLMRFCMYETEAALVD